MRKTGTHTKPYLMLMLMLSPFAGRAQRQTIHTNMVWAGYFNTTQISKRFSIGTDIQVRTKDWMDKWSQQVFRSGLSYKLNNNTSITAGIAYFNHVQYSDERIVNRNEWRPWQELSNQLKWNKLLVGQRLRTEQRFIQQVVNMQKTQDYNHTFRIRYRLELQLPIKGSCVAPILVNEVMFNPEQAGKAYFFDQNRTFAGVNIKATPTTTLQCQYMKIFQLRSNNTVENADVLRFNIQQQFNLKKKI